MEDIFLKEKKKLDEIRNIIDSRVDYLIKNNKYRDVSEYSLMEEGVNEDKIREIKEYTRKIEEEIDHIKSIYNEPYYGRMDFLVGKEELRKTIYVGEKALIVDENQLVHDWRSPLGNLYHTRNKYKIKLDEEEYRLVLRRVLRVENGQLISYKDEYSLRDELDILEDDHIDLGQELSLEEGPVITSDEKAVLLGEEVISTDEFEEDLQVEYDGISDPFLLNLIKDKRKHNKLTNIIKTIQDNQNEIIRLDEGENFIVQGCAGSGKTMIMLHRLSYLSYKNPNFRFDRTKIITPNKNFNLHIADLSSDLEIDHIEMYTVEEYYLYLLEKYRPEQWDQDNLVAREEVLGYDFIKTVYSDDFIRSCEESYKNYVEDLLNSFNDENITDILNKYAIESFEKSSPYAYKRINDYKGYLESIIDGNNINKFKVSELSREISNLEELIEEEKNRMKIEEETSIYGKLKRELNSMIDEEKNKLISISSTETLKNVVLKFDIDTNMSQDEFIENYSNILEDINSKNQHREKEFLKLLEEYEAKEKQYLEKKESYKETINLYRQIENMNRDKLIKLESELEDISIFNFIKKNAILANIESLKEDIVRSKAYYESNISDLIGLDLELNQIKNKKKLEEKSLLSDEEKSFLSDMDLEVETIKENIKRYRSNLTDLEYEHKGERSKLEIELDRMEKMQYEYNKIKKIIINEDDIRSLTEVILRLNNNSIEQVYEKTFKIKIDELKAKYQIPSLLGSLYRHELYLRLKFYSLYIGPIKGGDRYLNIDEGQDISINEYRTIKEVNGQKLVLNIYGDTHQLVGIRGIEYWDSIDWIEKKYYLEENYRNTIEITDFCNRELGLNISSIGISGKAVKLTDEDTALELIRDGLSYENERCAIIVTGILDSEFSEKCIKMGALKSRIAKGRISILTPLEAKGVEFERVFVYNRNMAINEKYISYTRALNELIVIR